jgi:hypothetical protein
VVGEDAAPDPNATERAALRTDLNTSLGFITGRVLEMRKQVLAADGLINFERDQMLSSVAALLAEAERLRRRLEILTPGDRPLAPSRTEPPTTEPPR